MQFVLFLPVETSLLLISFDKAEDHSVEECVTNSIKQYILLVFTYPKAAGDINAKSWIDELNTD